MSGRKRGSSKTGGREQGTPNKLTADVKSMVLRALDQVGGVEYLVQQAKENPVAFLTLLGKILPTQVTGENGGPLMASITVSFVDSG